MCAAPLNAAHYFITTLLHKLLIHRHFDYLNLLEENKCIIFNIRSSEMFSNKYILENENLVRRKKDEINSIIIDIENQYNKKQKEFEKLKKKK